MTGIESHQLNPSVEQPVLLDGDEAGHLPGELEGVLAGHHSVVVKESRSGPSMYFNIFPITVPRLLLTPSFSLISLVTAESVGRDTGVVPEAVVLDVGDGEAVEVPVLLDGQAGAGAELSLHEVPGDTGSRFSPDLAAEDHGVPWTTRDTLPLYTDHRGVYTAVG